MKTQEKKAKEKVEELGGFIIGAAHEAEVFKTHLDRMEDNVCKCRCTPSEVGEEFVSSEDKARTELSYASARGSEYIAPPLEKPIPIPILAPCHPCGLSTVLLALEEISKEPSFICEDLNSLLRGADEGRAWDLQEGPSTLVICLPPRVGLESWRRLNGIYQMHLGPGRREQRATRSRPYERRSSTSHPAELWGPGEAGRSSGSPPSSSLETINTSLLWGDE